MKVVLFCGGLGTRLREHADTIPKPLVNVGIRPIIWHLMHYYAHFGHKEFILCLGYRSANIAEQATDSMWTSGQPGIGFFKRTAGLNSDLAITSYTATSL